MIVLIEAGGSKLEVLLNDLQKADLLCLSFIGSGGATAVVVAVCTELGDTCRGDARAVVVDGTEFGDTGTGDLRVVTGTELGDTGTGDLRVVTGMELGDTGTGDLTAVTGTEHGDIGRGGAREVFLSGTELGDISSGHVRRLTVGERVSDVRGRLDLARSDVCDSRLLLLLLPCSDSLSLDDVKYSDVPSLLHARLDNVPSLLLQHVCVLATVKSRRDVGPM